jgi:fibro-slime domain-containing protein
MKNHGLLIWSVVWPAIFALPACQEDASPRPNSIVPFDSGFVDADPPKVDGGNPDDRGVVLIDATADQADSDASAVDPCQILEAGPDCNYQLVSGPACGDGLINQDFELCDDGNSLPGDGCSGACTLEPNFICPTPGQPCLSTIVCGDGNVTGGEVCDDGNAESGDGCPETCDTIEPGWVCETAGSPCVRQDPCKLPIPPVSCLPPPPPAAVFCGDGTVNQSSESCDDGNAKPGDGCSGLCTIEPHWSCPPSGGPCSSTILCGNGSREVGESCDDGNTTAGDGCSAQCLIESGDWVCPTPGQPCQRVSFCGDGRIKGAETCDDANTKPGDGCDANCQKEAGWLCLTPGQPCARVEVCGDAKISGSKGEVCDDGNTQDGDGCSADCRFVESGWSCPVPGRPCQSAVRCGDGRVTGNEECDDANTNPSDGCADCQLSPGYECPFPGAPCLPKCGDGIKILNERCDDGNQTSGDGCSPNCEWEPGWACSGTPPNYTCHRTTCGDGIEEGSEPCDDGNNDLGDGCTPFCQLEPDCSSGACRSTCGDGLLLASVGEVCDDGNDVSGDGCSSTCQVEAGYTCTRPPLADRMYVPLVVHDFTAGGDFEPPAATGLNAAVTGLVQNTLNAQGKPVLLTPGAFIISAASFAQWYVDVPLVNSVYKTQMVLWDNRLGGYVNRYGPNGEQWIITSNPNDHFCGTIGQEDHDANGVAIPCTFCPYDADPTTFQCDGQVGSPQPTDCQTLIPTLGPLYDCVAAGGQWHGVWLVAALDGTPTFFPLDGVPGMITPANEYGIAQISPPYGNWVAEASGVLHNFGFTSEVRYWFTYHAASSYVLEFMGDDDVWVFINRRLAVDLGGIHTAVDGRIELNAAGGGTVTITQAVPPGSAPTVHNVSLGLQDGQVYEIAVFQAERKTVASTYKLTLSGFNASRSECVPVCGDGVLTPGEQCDNGDNPGGYGQCNPDCTLGPYCGDSLISGPEECDDGVNNSPYGTTGCGPDCKRPARCGDAIVQADFGESCDDGTNSGGYGSCTVDCQRGPWCGDGVVQAGQEECDDGANDGSYDNCAPGCVLGPRCGDGITQTVWGEECDDGNTRAGDGCGPSCRFEGKCGDAVVQKERGETCDDGVNDGTYGHCTPDCQPGPGCGDGVVNGNEACDDGENTGAYGACAPGCALGPRCGDATVNGPEECDDGYNDGMHSNCSPGCVLGPSCGDGIVQPDLGELCDDGVNDGGYDECAPMCKLGPRCGDGQVQTGSGEQCDDGVNLGGYGQCQPGCKLGPRCGDGQVQASEGEICDDGVNLGGYGACAPGCRLGLYCGDGVLTQPYEQCDDGNQTAGDYCSPACRIEQLVPS